jgi:hypothetical protein
MYSKGFSIAKDIVIDEKLKKLMRDSPPSNTGRVKPRI